LEANPAVHMIIARKIICFNHFLEAVPASSLHKSPSRLIFRMMISGEDGRVSLLTVMVLVGSDRV